MRNGSTHQVHESQLLIFAWHHTPDALNSAVRLADQEWTTVAQG